MDGHGSDRINKPPSMKRKHATTEELAMRNVLLQGNTFKFNSDRKMKVN
jgi:hypothetical protein